jgi:subtilase family serine protease
MQGIPIDTNHCVPAYASYEVRVRIENRGDAPAANITVVEPSSGFKFQVEELAAAQTMELSLPVSSPTGSYNVSIDPQNLVAENNEGNNTASYQTITPTPPALCAPSATP